MKNEGPFSFMSFNRKILEWLSLNAYGIELKFEVLSVLLYLNKFHKRDFFLRCYNEFGGDVIGI